MTQVKKLFINLYGEYKGKYDNFTIEMDKEGELIVYGRKEYMYEADYLELLGTLQNVLDKYHIT